MLKDGQVFQGTYKSGSATTIIFEVDGADQTFAVESIMSLTFQRKAPKPEPAKQQAKPQTAPPSPPSGPVSVNAGTRLMIKTQSTLVTDKTKTGDRFTATLEADLVVNGETVAPQGSTVYGRVTESFKAGRVVGRAKLVLELTDLMINNQLYPLVSEQLGYEGERSGTLRKIAVGTAAGAVIDGGDGAGTGAAVGAGAAVLTKGRQIEIPSGAILEFRTTQPVTINRR
jgi:hypothetical protein